MNSIELCYTVIAILGLLYTGYPMNDARSPF